MLKALCNIKGKVLLRDLQLEGYPSGWRFLVADILKVYLPVLVDFL